ncbi:MAG: hypothetical protein M3680_12805 [Myxococcota bacterium]|nr:hypothetical protein [Myxococcota bacterium]
MIRHVVTAALVPAIVAGCTASSLESQSPEAQLYFPTGAAIAPGESHLFVANANSDLRFNSGAISVVDLAHVDAIIEAWLTAEEVPAGCSRDPGLRQTLVCPAELFLAATAGAGVRIGNFATAIAVQDRGGGRSRLVVPTRGDPSITWIDWEDGALRCGGSTDAQPLCDDEHRLTFGDEGAAASRDEPFAAYADSEHDFAIVTHLRTGAIRLIDSPRDGAARIADVVRNVFASHPKTRESGAIGVAGRATSTGDRVVYVGSTTDHRVQTFTVGRPSNGAPPFLLTGHHFFLDSVGPLDPGKATDTRSMAFSAGGDRLYLASRTPPLLQIFDTSPGPTGFPVNAPIGARDLCRQASTLTVADVGDGERVYVSCFEDGQVYIVDPRAGGRTDDIVTVGRGPFAVVAAPARRRLYVTNFLEDTIAVLDLTPGSATRNRVVLRIGEPRRR